MTQCLEVVKCPMVISLSLAAKFGFYRDVVHLLTEKQDIFRMDFIEEVRFA